MKDLIKETIREMVKAGELKLEVEHGYDYIRLFIACEDEHGKIENSYEDSIVKYK